MRAIAVLCALAAVISFRAAATNAGPEPAHLIPQGVTARVIPGAGHVFVDREGEVLYVIRATTKHGHPLVWCPYEELYWSPESEAIFDPSMRPAYAGKDPSDSPVLFKTIIDEKLNLAIAPGDGPHPPRSPVPQQVLSFYQAWLNRANTPAVKPLKWCPNPVS